MVILSIEKDAKGKRIPLAGDAWKEGCGKGR